MRIYFLLNRNITVKTLQFGYLFIFPVIIANYDTDFKTYKYFSLREAVINVTHFPLLNCLSILVHQQISIKNIFVYTYNRTYIRHTYANMCAFACN